MAKGRRKGSEEESNEPVPMDISSSAGYSDDRDMQELQSNNSMNAGSMQQSNTATVDLSTQKLAGRNVYVFGSGDCGQLGMGEDLDMQLTPLKHPKLAKLGITKISAGGMHTLALSEGGHIYSWGCNDEKALGHAAEEFDVGCVDTKIQEKTLFMDIASGDSISAGISRQGTLFAWGTFRDSKGVMGYDAKTEIREIPSVVEPLSHLTFKRIFSGSNHLLAITTDNVAYAWGCGEQGQLGRKVLERHKMLSLRPRIIFPPTRKTSDGSPCVFVKFSCGSYHTLGLTNDGTLYSWGLNNYGQLGLGDNEDRVAPELIPTEAFDNLKIVDLASGEHHSIVLAENGRVFTFGRGDSYQLGTGNTSASNIPVLVPSLSNIIAVASGSSHCFGIHQDGSVYVWGYGDQGQLGTGKEEDEKIPFRLPNIRGRVIQVSAGGQHSALLVQE